MSRIPTPNTAADAPEKSRPLLVVSNDSWADTVVRFAAAVTRARGHVAEADLSAVGTAGATDAQVIEIVQHVALNTWTNYLNEVFKTDIDFPAVGPRRAA